MVQVLPAPQILHDLRKHFTQEFQEFVFINHVKLNPLNHQRGKRFENLAKIQKFANIFNFFLN